MSMSGASKRKAVPPRKIIRETLSDGSESLVAHSNGCLKCDRTLSLTGQASCPYDFGGANPIRYDAGKHPAAPHASVGIAPAKGFVSPGLSQIDQVACEGFQGRGSDRRDKNGKIDSLQRFGDRLNHEEAMCLHEMPAGKDCILAESHLDTTSCKAKSESHACYDACDGSANAFFAVSQSADQIVPVTSLDAGQENRKAESQSSSQLLCEVCHVPFGSPDVLKEHRRAAHGKKFQCKYCSKRFNDKYNMRKHVLIHVGEKKHKCEFCEKRFLRKDHLRSHLQTHYSRKFGCKICGRGFKTLDTYQKHVKVHREDTYLSMTNNLDDMQPLIAPSSSEASANASHWFKSEDVDSRPLVLQNGTQSGVHQRNVFVSNAPMFALGDPSPTEVSENFLPTVPSGKSESAGCTRHSGEDAVVEDTCSMEKSGGADFVNLRGVECEDCGSKLIDEESRHAHRSSCPLRSWSCGRCGILFDSASVLRQHCVKVHAIEQTSSNWKCKTCDVDCCNSKELSQHYAAAHIDIQNFACSVCARKFVDRYNLKKHMLIHVGLKKHRCPVCDKGFVRKDHLNTHMKVHNRDVRFSCHVCAKSFRIKDLYHKHMNLHGLEGTVCQEELHSRLPHHDLHPVVDAM